MARPYQTKEIRKNPLRIACRKTDKRRQSGRPGVEFAAQKLSLSGETGEPELALEPIQHGRDFGDRIEVTAGLASEDRVIDSPPETVQSGEAVRLASAASSTAPPSVAGP